MQYWCRKSHLGSRNAKEKTFRVETNWQYQITLHSKAFQCVGDQTYKYWQTPMDLVCKIIANLNTVISSKKTESSVILLKESILDFLLNIEMVKWNATLAKVTQPLLRLQSLKHLHTAQFNDFLGFQTHFDNLKIIDWILRKTNVSNVIFLSRNLSPVELTISKIFEHGLIGWISLISI